MPTFPTIDFPTIDLTRLNLRGVKLPFDLPKIDLPKIDFSSLDLANVDLPSAEQVIDFFRDATLVGTGLVSLTAERIAELQKALVEALTTQVEKVRAAV